MRYPAPAKVMQQIDVFNRNITPRQKNVNFIFYFLSTEECALTRAITTLTNRRPLEYASEDRTHHFKIILNHIILQQCLQAANDYRITFHKNLTEW